MKGQFKGYWKIGLIFGGLFALVYLGYLHVKYHFLYQDPMVYHVSTFISYLVFMIVLLSCGIYLRRKYGGAGIGSRQIFQALFMIILCTEIVYFGYSYIYLVHVHPGFQMEFLEVIKNYQLSVGMSEEEVSEAVEAVIEDLDESNSLKYHLRGVFIWIVIDSIVAILMSLFLKKQAPLYE